MSAAAATRTGAIGFSDLVGFTQLTAEHGDQIALALVERQEELTRAVLPPGARIVKQLGDGLLLFFADAADALAACRALHDRAEQACVEGIDLWIRTGLHWGSPRARGDDLIGHDVNLAARVADLAGPGEILVTETFRRALPPSAQAGTELVGPVFIKGVADPQVLHRAG